MTRPSVSVVLPNYNHARYLPCVLGSIAGQTDPPEEVIVLDDASTDDSLSVIEAWRGRIPGLRVEALARNGGVVAAMNRGIALARGDALAFVAADDAWAPRFIATARAGLMEFPDAALFAGCVALFGDVRAAIRPIIPPAAVAGFVSPERFAAWLGGADNPFVGTVMLYRRAALACVPPPPAPLPQAGEEGHAPQAWVGEGASPGGFDASLGSLTDSLAARILALRHGFVFVPEVLGYWRIHGANYSTTSATDPARIEAMIARMREVLAEQPVGVVPDGYADRLARRLQFGGARLLVEEGAAGSARLSRMVGGGAVWRGLATLGAPGRFAALALLALVLRPFSPAALWRGRRIRLRIVADPLPAGCAEAHSK